MSGTDITNLLDIVQRKINAVDSSASTSDLLYLLSAIRQSGEGSVFAYDNESQIPNLLDGTPDPEMITYTLDSDKLYFQRGSWVGKKLPFPPFQGSNYGYVSGGNVTAGYRDAVERFSFISDGGGTDVGNLSVGRYNCSGQSSSTHGYTSGGIGGDGNVIDKFPFTSGFTTATDVGNLTGGRNNVAGQSSIPNGYGYNTGGGNVIDKFSFATDGDATVAGNTLTSRSSAVGQSSTTHGYTSGNYPATNVIDKFPFSSDGNSTDVGDLTVARGGAAGQSSSTHGYTSGGFTGPGDPNRNDTIDKFPFASNANATDVGDLSVTRNACVGQSSTTHGYSAGGWEPGGGPTAPSNVIDKFPFASDFSGTATDVGNLTWRRYQGTGQQY
jgi:hypothetical protein